MNKQQCVACKYGRPTVSVHLFEKLYVLNKLSLTWENVD